MILRELRARATKRVFDERCKLDELAPLIEAFDQGWNVEVSSGMSASEVLTGLDEIEGLRAAAQTLAEGDSPERLASAVEFLLEGLHLANKLNKSASEGRARYGRA